MSDSLPPRGQVTAMPVDVLARCVLRLLASPGGIPVATRTDLVNFATTHHAIEMHREGGVEGTVAMHSRDALALLPDVARAYAEAWDALLRERLIAIAPDGRSAYVTAAGSAQLARPAGQRSPQVAPAPVSMTPDEERLAAAKPATTDHGGDGGHDVQLAVGSLAVAVTVVVAARAPWWIAVMGTVVLTLVLMIAIPLVVPAVRRVTARLPGRHVRLRGGVVLGCVLAVAAGVVGWVLVAPSADAPSGLTRPPEGWFTNASTGRASAPRRIDPARDGSESELEGGDIFYACNDSLAEGCVFPPGERAVDARRGDRIRLRVRLHIPRDARMGLLKLNITAARGQRPRQLVAYLSIEWPDVHDGGLAFTSDTATIRVPDDSAYDLRYVPDSTRLLGSTHMRGGRRTIALLPDGIMGRSVILTHVGPPPGCWDCDLEYTRYVELLARLS